MKAEVTIRSGAGNGADRALELETPPLSSEGRSTVRWGGAAPCGVEIERLEADRVVLRVFDPDGGGGSRHELLRLESSALRPGEICLLAGNRPYILRLETELDRLRERSRSRRRRSEPELIHSQLPGIVRQVLVQSGSRVRAGEPLMTLEAMKMENEIRADFDGVVEAIFVKPGEVVPARALLARLVPLPLEDAPAAGT